jgi:hypothetical protein
VRSSSRLRIGIVVWSEELFLIKQQATSMYTFGRTFATSLLVENPTSILVRSQDLEDTSITDQSSPLQKLQGLDWSVIEVSSWSGRTRFPYNPES